MKYEKLIFCMLVLFNLACTDNNSSVSSPRPEKEKIEVLDFIKAEKIADTPISNVDASIISDDVLYAVDSLSTYSFNLVTKEWATLSENENILYAAQLFANVSFIRNGKWNIFTDAGLYEFDFESKLWDKIHTFPAQNGIFSPQGYYVNDELIFIDRENRNKEIYKYDFENNLIVPYSDFEGIYYIYTLRPSALKTSESFYYLTALNSNIGILKFSPDFKNLELLDFNKSQGAGANKIFPGSPTASYSDKVIIGFSRADDGSGNFPIENPDFHVYDPEENNFYEMPSTFYESRRGATIFTWQNGCYLLGGFINNDNQKIQRNIIEKLTFEKIKI